MTRTNYKGYIIDTDNLGRLYIYNTASPYSEDSDKKLIASAIMSKRTQNTGDITLKEIKAYIDTIAN